MAGVDACQPPLLHSEGRNRGPWSKRGLLQCAASALLQERIVTAADVLGAPEAAASAGTAAYSFHIDRVLAP